MPSLETKIKNNPPNLDFLLQLGSNIQAMEAAHDYNSLNIIEFFHSSQDRSNARTAVANHPDRVPPANCTVSPTSYANWMHLQNRIYRDIQIIQFNPNQDLPRLADLLHMANMVDQGCYQPDPGETTLRDPIEILNYSYHSNTER